MAAYGSTVAHIDGGYTYTAHLLHGDTYAHEDTLVPGDTNGHEEALFRGDTFV